jgi:hypothetical protein
MLSPVVALGQSSQVRDFRNGSAPTHSSNNRCLPMVNGALHENCSCKVMGVGISVDCGQIIIEPAIMPLLAHVMMVWKLRVRYFVILLLS